MLHKFPSLFELEKILELSWCAETSTRPERWTEYNPALGQSTATSLVLQDHLGGEIVNCDVNGMSHYYNIIDEKEIDLTKSQFPKGTIILKGAPKPGEFESTRQYVLGANPNTLKRYNTLKIRVDAHLFAMFYKRRN